MKVLIPYVDYDSQILSSSMRNCACHGHLTAWVQLWD